MGYPYNELIAPAILLDNPRINRERFVELLDKTHSSHFQEYKRSERWNYYDKKLEDPRYHEGFEGLARILGLDYTYQYKKFQETAFDENRLAIEPPFLIPVDEKEKSPYKIQVIIHEKNIVGKPEPRNELAWGKLSIGDVWQECQTGIEYGLVTKIFKEEFIGEKDKGEEYDSGPQYRYKMEIRPIQKDGRTEQFRSEEELYKKWPQFHPDLKYDWSQERGVFTVGIMGGKNFLWINKNGLYYLDEETFNKIPVSFGRYSSLGYVDLILTSEAIKHNAWKILSYKGKQHMIDLLRDFPDIKEKHERAVWDAYTSIYAKNNNLTVTEFLRGRIPPFHFFKF